jgi:hypothetical protein
MFKARKATKGERILALEKRCERLERELGEEKERREALKKDAQGLFEEIADLFEAQQKRIEALEAKVAELEAKRVPVISDLTGGGNKEKPVTAKQIMDEWLNGKAEGGEGK